MSTNPIEIDNGGPAFPVADTIYPNGQIQYGSNGMQLRDYFAGEASKMFLTQSDRKQYKYKEMAQFSFLFADAMIKARNLSPQELSNFDSIN